jgi:hypothetical protein
MQKPNLDYINKLADGDEEFKHNLISVLKKEFPEEVKVFQENYKTKKFKEAAHNIHKVKYKFSLLGLDDDFNLASNFENKIKKEKTGLYSKFNEVLLKINLFLKNI